MALGTKISAIAMMAALSRIYLIITVSLLHLWISSIKSPAQTAINSNIIVDSSNLARLKARLNAIKVDKFEKKVFYFKNTTLPYRLLRPCSTHQGKKYPLIITLHNSSRIGSDNENQLEPIARIWLPHRIRKKYPCFVMAPQFNQRSSNYSMDSTRMVLTSSPTNDVYVLLELIKNTITNDPLIDSKKVYVVGYSMGASTAQNLFNLNPDIFAALVSIAAVPDFSHTTQLKNKNIWLIHGAKDSDNPYDGSALLFGAMEGNRKLLFTTYNNLTHHNIIAPFLDKNLIQNWLFDKRITEK